MGRAIQPTPQLVPTSTIAVTGPSTAGREERQGPTVVEVARRAIHLMSRASTLRSQRRPSH